MYVYIYIYIYYVYITYQYIYIYICIYIVYIIMYIYMYFHSLLRLRNYTMLTTKVNLPMFYAFTCILLSLFMYILVFTVRDVLQIKDESDVLIQKCPV